MPRPATEASKQKNLSKFFSPKVSIPVKIQDEWDRSNSQFTKMELNREKRSANVDDVVMIPKKRVLPQSIGGSQSAGAAYKPPKGTPSIGGVSFKESTGLTIYLIRSFRCVTSVQSTTFLTNCVHHSTV